MKPPTQSKITARTVEALRILQERQPRSHAYFAELFWPGNDMHARYSNAGTHGARRGAGAWLSSGSYLAKLEKRGLIHRRRYGDSSSRPIATLTAEGARILKESRESR